MKGLEQSDWFDEIMKQYGSEILYIVYQYVKDYQLSEDLTQEIFIKVFKNYNTFRENSSLKTWIFRIAVNHCRDYLRSWHYKYTRVNETIFKLMKSENPTPEQALISNDTSNQLVTDVMSLPMQYREVIFFYFFEELTMNEISDLLNISINTVKTRLYRAKNLLKRKAEARGETPWTIN